jgi:hypothetical protein
VYAEAVVVYFLIVFWHLPGMTNVLNKPCTRNKRPLCVDVNLGPPQLDASILGQVQMCQEILFLFLFIYFVFTHQ